MRGLEKDLIARILLGVASLVACGRIASNEAQPPFETPSQAGEASGPNASAGSGAAPMTTSEQLLPWKVGNSWNYRVSEEGKSSTEKTTSIGPTEIVGGVGPNVDVIANLVTTIETNGKRTASWQGPSPLNFARIVRFRERDQDSSSALPMESHYDAEKLHVDDTPEHTRTNATWIEEYAEVAVRSGHELASMQHEDSWTVLSDDGTVTVPAGTFTSVICLRKEGSAHVKHYWYVRGIGKVKEQGDRVEELVSYHLEP